MPLTPKQQPPYYQPATSPSTQPLQYIAILTQTGTNPPTAVVLKNTTGGTVTYSYSSTGNFLGTLAGAFTLNKTTYMIQQNNDGGLGIFYIMQNTVNNFLINTLDFSFSPSNDMLLDTTIEINIYP